MKTEQRQLTSGHAVLALLRVAQPVRAALSITKDRNSALHALAGREDVEAKDVAVVRNAVPLRANLPDRLQKARNLRIFDAVSHHRGQ